MTPLDAGLVVFVALMALSGFRRGLVVGALSLAGLVAGAYLGARLIPSLVGAETSRYLPLVTFAGAIGLAALGQSLAVLLARPLRPALAIPPLAAVNRLGGGLLGAATGLALCWVLGSVLLYLPDQVELRRHAQESTILSTLNDEFPPGRLMDALARVDPFATLAGPAASVDPPDPAIVGDPDVHAAAPSVVRVTGYACGLGIEGSGFVVAPEVVVTNAHVVAGVDGPRVDRHDGVGHAATVVAFDRRNDLALLHVPGLAAPALRLLRGQRGVPVALLGFPANGPYAAAPARLGGTITSIGRDAYGNFPVTRTVTPIRGPIRSGNSGGPAVDAAGRVRAVVFAQRAGSEGGYGVPTELVADLLASAGTAPLETECVER